MRWVYFRSAPGASRADRGLWSARFDTGGVGVIPLGIIGVMAMTLRLTEEQTAKLRATAEREGVSMQAVALKAIDEYVDRRMQRRDEIIEQIFTEDAELFRRLAVS